eukprot:m.20152 g.20152  ORF g.20152 m.20152 type:complete len:2942 (+) comp27981_c0_seq1:9-8834(+)
MQLGRQALLALVVATALLASSAADHPVAEKGKPFCAEAMAKCNANEACKDLFALTMHHCGKAGYYGHRRHCTKDCADAYDKFIADDIGRNLDDCRCRKEEEDNCLKRRINLHKACRERHGHRALCKGRGLSCQVTYAGPPGTMEPCKPALKECNLDKCCREASFQFFYGDSDCTKVFGYLGMGPEPKCPTKCIRAFELLNDQPLGNALFTCHCGELGSACPAHTPLQNYETYCVERRNPLPVMMQPTTTSESDGGPAQEKEESHSHEEEAEGEGDDTGGEAEGEEAGAEVEGEDGRRKRRDDHGMEQHEELCSQIYDDCLEDNNCRCLRATAQECFDKTDCSADCAKKFGDLFCSPIGQKFRTCKCDAALGPACHMMKKQVLPLCNAELSQRNCSANPSPKNPQNCPLVPDCATSLLYCLKDSECRRLFDDAYFGECAATLADAGVSDSPPSCPQSCFDKFDKLNKNKRGSSLISCNCGRLGTVCSRSRINFLLHCTLPRPKPLCSSAMAQCNGDPACKILFETFLLGDACKNVFQYNGFAPSPPCSDECVKAERELRAHPIASRLLDCDCGPLGDTCSRPRKNFELYCSSCPNIPCTSVAGKCQKHPQCLKDLANFGDPQGPCGAIVAYNGQGTKPPCNPCCIDAVKKLTRHNARAFDCTAEPTDFFANARNKFLTICPDFRSPFTPAPTDTDSPGTCHGTCKEVYKKCSLDKCCREASFQFFHADPDCSRVIAYAGIGPEPTCPKKCVQAFEHLNSLPLGKAQFTCNCEDLGNACTANAPRINYQTYCVERKKPQPEAEEQSEPSEKESCSKVMTDCVEDESCLCLLTHTHACILEGKCSVECEEHQGAFLCHPLGRRLTACECDDISGPACIALKQKAALMCRDSERLRNLNCSANSKPVTLPCAKPPFCAAPMAVCLMDPECKSLFEKASFGECAPSLTDFGVVSPTPRCPKSCFENFQKLVSHKKGRLAAGCMCGELGTLCSTTRQNFLCHCAAPKPQPTCSSVIAECNTDEGCKNVLNAFLFGEACKNVFSYRGFAPLPICSPDCVKAEYQLRAHPIASRLVDCDCGDLGDACSRPRQNFDLYCSSCPKVPCDSILADCQKDPQCVRDFADFGDPKGPCGAIMAYNGTGEKPACDPCCLDAVRNLTEHSPRSLDCSAGPNDFITTSRNKLLTVCPDFRTSSLVCRPAPVEMCVDSHKRCGADKECSAIRDAVRNSCTNVFDYDGTGEEPVCSAACINAAEQMNNPTTNFLNNCHCGEWELCNRRVNNFGKFCLRTPPCNQIVTECNNDPACKGAFAEFMTGKACKPVIVQTDEMPKCTPECIKARQCLINHPIGKFFETCECGPLGDTCSLPRSRYEKYCIAPPLPSVQSCASVVANCIANEECKAAFNDFSPGPNSKCKAVFEAKVGQCPAPQVCSTDCIAARNKLISHSIGKGFDVCDCGTLGSVCSFSRNQYDKFCSPCAIVRTQCQGDVACREALDAYLNGQACRAVFTASDADVGLCTSACVGVHDKLMSDPIGKKFADCSCVDSGPLCSQRGKYLKQCRVCSNVLAACQTEATCKKAWNDFNTGEYCSGILSYDETGTRQACNWECLRHNVALLQHPIARQMTSCDCGSDPVFSASCNQRRQNFFASCPSLTKCSTNKPSSCSCQLEKCFNDPLCADVFNRMSSQCEDVLNYDGTGTAPECTYTCRVLAVELEGYVDLAGCECDEVGPFCQRFQYNVKTICPREDCSAVAAKCSESEECQAALSSFVGGGACADIVHHCSGDTPQCTPTCFLEYLDLMFHARGFETCICGNDDAPCSTMRSNYFKYCPRTELTGSLSCDSSCEDAMAWCLRNASCRLLYAEMTLKCGNVAFYDGTGNPPTCSDDCREVENRLLAAFKGQKTNLRECQCREGAASASRLCKSIFNNIARYCPLQCDDVKEECKGDSACNTRLNLFENEKTCAEVLSYNGTGDNPVCFPLGCGYQAFALTRNPIGRHLKSCECTGSGCTNGKLNTMQFCPIANCIADGPNSCSCLFDCCSRDASCNALIDRFPLDCAVLLAYNGTGVAPPCPEQCLKTGQTLLSLTAGASSSSLLNCQCESLGPLCSTLQKNFNDICLTKPPPCTQIVGGCSNDVSCKKAFDEFMTGEACKPVLTYRNGQGDPPKCSSECIKTRQCLINNPLGKFFESCDCGILGPACALPRANYDQFCENPQCPPKQPCAGVVAKCTADESCAAAFKDFSPGPDSKCKDVFNAEDGSEVVCSSECTAARNKMISHPIGKGFDWCDCAGLGPLCSSPKEKYDNHCSPCTKVRNQCRCDVACSEALDAYLNGPACQAVFTSEDADIGKCSANCVEARDRLMSDPIGKKFADCDCADSGPLCQEREKYANQCDSCTNVLAACEADTVCKMAWTSFSTGDACNAILTYDGTGTRPECQWECMSANIALLQHPLGRQMASCDCGSGAFSALCKASRDNYFASCPALKQCSAEKPSSCSCKLKKCFNDPACSEVFNRMSKNCGDILNYDGSSQSEAPKCRYECRLLEAELESYISLSDCECGELGEFCKRLQNNLNTICSRDECSVVAEECTKSDECSAALITFTRGEACAGVIHHCSGSTPQCSRECFLDYLTLMSHERRFETCKCQGDPICRLAQGNYIKYCPTANMLESLAYDTPCDDVIAWCYHHTACRIAFAELFAECRHVADYDGNGEPPTCSEECRQAEERWYATFSGQKTDGRTCQCREGSMHSSQLCRTSFRNHKKYCPVRCSDVVKQCEADSVCNSLWQPFKSNEKCAAILSYNGTGESPMCDPLNCAHVFFAIVRNPIGRNLRICECDGPGCTNGRYNAIQVCATPNCQADGPGSCSCLFDSCSRESSCNDLIDRFNLDCAVVNAYDGTGESPQCTEQCLNSGNALIKRTSDNGVDLLNCSCGSLGPLCTSIQRNFQNLCLTTSS